MADRVQIGKMKPRQGEGACVFLEIVQKHPNYYRWTLDMLGDLVMGTYIALEAGVTLTGSGSEFMVFVVPHVHRGMKGM